jgi:hypothetical protein
MGGKGTEGDMQGLDELQTLGFRVGGIRRKGGNIYGNNNQKKRKPTTFLSKIKSSERLPFSVGKEWAQGRNGTTRARGIVGVLGGGTMRIAGRTKKDVP